MRESGGVRVRYSRGYPDWPFNPLRVLLVVLALQLGPSGTWAGRARNSWHDSIVAFALLSTRSLGCGGESATQARSPRPARERAHHALAFAMLSPSSTHYAGVVPARSSLLALLELACDRAA